MLQAFTADHVFPVSSPPVKNGVVVTDERGEIQGVYTKEQFAAEKFSEKPVLQKYSGIICPGFINAHCHLELSHMRGLLKEGKTLPGFIGEIIKGREADKEKIEKAIEEAEAEMIANGIVGVGDICNTTDTIFQKKKGRLRYHNFIEVFDIVPSKADEAFEKGISLLQKFNETGNTGSIIPHAPYTVSAKLLKRIYEHAYTHDSVLTIHNQETATENEMFLSKSGALFEKLSSFGDLYKNWKHTGFSSLASTLAHLPRCNKTMLVHNTYSTQEDINWAHLYSSVIYWCFCPNANLYIENRLPDFHTFINSSCRIIIGTDSLASNHSLSVLEELKTISANAPFIKLETLLKWGTLNGADFFDWKKDLGSLEKGKRPGINLITDVNTATLALTETSIVKPLLSR
ncbi:MAG: amidohydrolase family protein [Bacteroidetes bacterium]|nr:amidohydrolase family protein [Bacteroidota bacterium]